MDEQERSAICDLEETLQKQIDIYGRMRENGEISLPDMDKLLELRSTQLQLSDYLERISRYWERTAAAEKAAGA
ncbi:MAG: hypothetical protein M1482_10925 [Chloroflexi bacterium]|nr:hypothetical protein [Chloroflexota bacterium]